VVAIFFLSAMLDPYNIQEGITNPSLSAPKKIIQRQSGLELASSTGSSRLIYKF